MISKLANLNNNFLVQSPQKVAKKIVQNMLKCNGKTFTIGGIWCLISIGIRLIPEKLYRRLTL